MRFSAWFPASEIEDTAPDGEGVYQVRTGEVRDYPRGRSAMAHYEAAANLRAQMRRFADAHPESELLYRFADELGASTPEAALEKLVRRFTERFGSAPRLE